MQPSVDIGKAFTHIIEDPEWSTKAILGSLIALVPILNFTLAGYEVQVARNVSKGEPRPMPSWDNFGDFFMDGLWLSLARIIYSLPVFLFLAFIFLAGFALLFLPVLAASAPDRDTLERMVSLGIGTWMLVGMCGFGVAMLYNLIYGFFFYAITANYIRHGTFASCFDLQAIFAFIRPNLSNYLMVWVAGLGAGLLYAVAYSIVAVIPCVGTFLAIPLSAAGVFYLYMVIGHALGQAMALEASSAAAKEPAPGAA